MSLAARTSAKPESVVKMLTQFRHMIKDHIHLTAARITNKQRIEERTEELATQQRFIEEELKPQHTISATIPGGMSVRGRRRRLYKQVLDDGQEGFPSDDEEYMPYE